jgi:hypothetical protein
MKMGLSNRRHVPCWRVANAPDYSFPIWERAYARAVEESELLLDRDGVCVFKEILDVGRLYLPPFSLKNKVVLDIGSCCGETAFLFLKNGARKVICIERNLDKIRLIRENKRRLNLNVDVIPESFCLRHLNLDYDFIKCDVEGYEMVLIDYARSLKPCVLEVHNLWIRDQFLKRGFRDLTKFTGIGIGLMCNW